MSPAIYFEIQLKSSYQIMVLVALGFSPSETAAMLCMYIFAQLNRH